jgi:signal transduction histidine kinase
VNVLVVDDNETNRKLLGFLLRSHQIETVEAADGVQALEILEREKIDVVISDILMPRMDGFHLCHEVRNNPRLQNVGVVMCTATDFTPEDEARANSLGADRFLKKGGSSGEILAAVRETMEEIGQKRRRHVPVAGEYPELQVMKEYSEAMIHKLEQKSIELEFAREELRKVNAVLEQRVRDRTTELVALNKELEAFGYSVSHDLRAPLRWIDGYCDLLTKECEDRLTPQGKECVAQILKAHQRMSHLIDDLLALSRVTQSELHAKEVDLSAMAEDVVAKLEAAEPRSHANIVIQPGMKARGDESLLRIALENLLGNAWKYTARTTEPRIQFGQKEIDGRLVHWVRDNGVGFDREYAQKLFEPFQRFHAKSDFPGNGIGLATVQRILRRHGGRIWAESRAGEGATFFFTLEEEPR